METPDSEKTRDLSAEESTFLESRASGHRRAMLAALPPVGLIIVWLVWLSYAEGEPLVGVLFLAFVAGVMGFLYKYGTHEPPENESPRVVSWRGRLVQRASGLKVTTWFGGRRVQVPHHWIDFVPGDVEFEGEAAVLPDQFYPYLLKTGTGLSVEKEAEWGLLETFIARPQRRIAFYFGGVFILFYLGVAGVEISESKPLLEILLLGRIGIVGLGFTAGFFLLGMPGLYFFIKHRLSLWRIRENYRAEGVEGVPSREEFTKIKAEQIAFMSAIGVPLMTILSWLVFGLPLVGLVAGMIGGVWMGYFSRNLSPWR